MNRFRPWLRPLVILCIVLLVPAIPFLILGEAFEAQIQDWVQQNWNLRTQFWAVVLVLTVDIFLPVPSSGVSTYAGGVLGLAWGTAASWLGMTLGSLLGFALARVGGRPLADRFGGDDVGQLQTVAHHHGAVALAITRPLPLLAEACVLLLGAVHFPWRRFVPVLLLTNLAISLTYAAVGAFFGERDALPAAMAASVLIPLIAAMRARRRLRSIDPAGIGAQSPSET